MVPLFLLDVLRELIKLFKIIRNLYAGIYMN